MGKEGKIEEQELTDEEKEKREKKEMNNFHMWMPGGAYRLRETKRDSSSGKKIIEGVDGAISEIDFDVEKWNEDYTELCNLLTEAVEAYKTKDTEKVKEISSRINELDEPIKDMTHQVYKKMLEMGFDKDGITG